MSAPYKGQSSTKGTPGIIGDNTNGGDGVWGQANATPNPGRGLVGISDAGTGVWGDSKTGRAVVGVVREKGDAVWGETKSGRGVVGVSEDDGTGVLGICKVAGSGVHGVGESRNTTGVVGESVEGLGVQGKSKSGRGLHGFSETGSGVFGECRNGRAVEGWSETNYGVSGDSKTFVGVRGTSVKSTGTEGWSTSGTGVFGTSQTGVAIHGKGGRLAGFFEGDVEVTGDIRLTNADCAEDFDVSGADKVEPGTVMVLGAEGVLSECQLAYDKRVAGVISGAGDYKPGIVLDTRQSLGNRQPIALMGKVFCKVDAQFGTIAVGDLLTTSATPGHAMKTSDPLKAFGAVIGKALRPLADGKGLIPILIALQ
jgi:hypothetical protein